MPEIKPLRGILYDQRRVNIPDVVAPPYDVISPDLQRSLYARDPHNVVRLILNNESNPYAAASREYAGWRRDAVLQSDKEPSIYVLCQSFVSPDGLPAERWGFIAACRLEDFGTGSVFPHEKTLAGPREDRFRLFQATGAMFSQIFGLYNDAANKLDAAVRSVLPEKPHVEVEYESVRNRMWRLTDESRRNQLSAFLSGAKVFIADGHHRYETALVYRDSRRLKNPGHTGAEAYNFVPMYFTNMSDPGLHIYATHRLVHSIHDFQPERLIAACAESFDVRELPTAEQLLAALQFARRGAFGLVLSHPLRFCLLMARADVVRRKLQGLPPVVADLDVTLLHAIVFRDILGMTDEAQEKKLYLRYEKEERRAIEQASNGESQAAFIMNPTPVEQVRAVASAGMLMPQKSTFFYPKLLSGLVMYSFDEP